MSCSSKLSICQAQSAMHDNGWHGMLRTSLTAISALREAAKLSPTVLDNVCHGLKPLVHGRRQQAETCRALAVQIGQNRRMYMLVTKIIGCERLSERKVAQESLRRMPSISERIVRTSLVFSSASLSRAEHCRRHGNCQASLQMLSMLGKDAYWFLYKNKLHMPQVIPQRSQALK